MRNNPHVDHDPTALMRRVADHDDSAFEMLYDAYSRMVYCVALRMLGDQAAAEDLVQAVFLKLWTAPHLFAGGNFDAWLVRVTRNRALDVLRSRSSHDDRELPEALPENESIENIAFSRLDADKLRAAVASLPPEQREPIELGFFSGITHEEIARQTGIPLGTIKTRIRTGLRKLRAALEGAVIA